jgi:pimeloyl-ACP methyl ester carboxylesterase
MADQTELLPGPPPCVVHHRFATVNGVRLHYVEAGPADVQTATAKGMASGSAPLCLALHGFPEFWYSWRRQIGPLAAAGFRVLAPDLRGYNLSAKPRGVAAYRPEALTADVAALVRHAGEASAAVVGHDWGGVLAWLLPRHHPGVVSRRVILNAPHPAALRRELRRGFDQRLRSWYVLFFQLPLLPEAAIRAGNFALLRRMLHRQPLRPGAFTDGDVIAYRDALARPGALTAALNWYRAAFRRRFQTADDAPCATPTLVLWGECDPYLGPRLTEGLERWAPGVRVERIPDASHWLQNDAPERVNALMIDFLRR